MVDSLLSNYNIIVLFNILMFMYKHHVLFASMF